MTSGIHLLVSDRHGVFIPQIFSQDHSYEWGGLLDEDLRILNHGPDHSEYWDAWEYVANSAFCVDTQGNTWKLYQDGDLWAICDHLMTDEEYENFFGEKRE